MLNFPKLQLTNQGKLLISESMKGIAYNFTKFQLGSGTPLVPPANMTALITPEISAAITGAVRTGNAVTLSASFDNSDVNTAFHASELGLYAQQTGGSEVLYAYAYEDDDPSLIPSSQTRGFMEETFYYTVAIGDAVNLSVNIGNALASMQLVPGSYIGDGTQGKKVSLGFTPRAVILNPAYIDTSHATDVYGGMTVAGVNVISNATPSGSRAGAIESWSNDYSALGIVAGGFQINLQTTNGIRTNENGRYYTYIAIR